MRPPAATGATAVTTSTPSPGLNVTNGVTAAAIHLLVVEDTPHDVDLLAAQLADGGLAASLRRVETADEFERALDSQAWDAVISDFHVPDFGARPALAIVKSRQLDLPFIVVSSRIGEEIAVELMKAGAHDFVMKSNLARLAPALQRELHEAVLRRQHREAEARVRELTQALHQAREEEQARIARELHDELGQMLTAIKLDVSLVGAGLRDGARGAGDRIAAICNYIDDAMNAVRRIAADLRPVMLDDLGLSAAIDWQLRKLRDMTQARTSLHELLEDAELDASIAFTAYRVTQECLTNIARHAGADSVSVHLERAGDTLLLEIADNGCGIAPAATGNGRQPLGLVGARERVEAAGGTLEIETAAGKGTTVRVRMPWRDAAEMERT